METKRTTSFIKKIDQYLLKNFPVTWSSRIHTAGIYSIGFALLIAILSFIAPNDPRSYSSIHYWITFMIVLSLLGFIFWMIYLLRFNVFKRFGTWKNTDTLKSFIFYFLITLTIFSWAFIPPIIESIRANAAYTSEELAIDMNAMNIKICQLEQDSIPRRFARDTFELDNSVRGYERPISRRNGMQNEISDGQEIENYYLIDSTTLRSKLALADSIQKLTDSVYVIYECPDYKFVNEYGIDPRSDIRVLRKMDIYRQVLQTRQSIDKEKVRRELGQLFIKYSPDHDSATLRTKYRSYDYYNNDYGENSYHSKIMYKYDLYRINQRIENIADKKYRWDTETISISWRVLYYFTLVFSLLVLIYRHTTRRTFFLSLLSAVVLSILTGIFIAMTHTISNGDYSFFIWTITYFILFAILTALIFNSRNRTLVTGIGLNLLVFMTPFMPTVITGLYYQYLRNKYDYSVHPMKYVQVFENEDYHFLLSEIGGGILLILLLATIYQRAYRRWFALPEQ